MVGARASCRYQVGNYYRQCGESRDGEDLNLSARIHQASREPSGGASGGIAPRAGRCGRAGRAVVPGLHERTGRGPDYYPSRLPEEADLQVVAVAEGRVVGLALGSLSHDCATAVVGEVAVEPNCQRRGVGRAMLAELEVRATARGLRHLVLGADDDVAEFYLACGWATRVQATVRGPERRAILQRLRTQDLAGYEVDGQQEDGSALRVWVPVEGYDRALAEQLSAIEGCSALVLFTKTLPGP